MYTLKGGENVAGIGVASTVLWQGEPSQIFDLMRSFELTEMEVWAQHFETRGFSTGEFQALAERNAIDLCVHSYSWDLNPASLNRGIRRASVREITRAINLAHQLGAGEVTVHPGRMTLPGDRELYEEYMRGSLYEIVDYGTSLNIEISLEIMEKIPKEIFTDLESVERVSRGIPCSFTLDIAHCDSEKEGLDILEASDRISKVHISNRRGKVYHTTLDEGDFDFDRLLPRLLEKNLPLILEGLDFDGSFPVFNRNMDYLKRRRIER